MLIALPHSNGYQPLRCLIVWRAFETAEEIYTRKPCLSQSACEFCPGVDTDSEGEDSMVSASNQCPTVLDPVPTTGTEEYLLQEVSDGDAITCRGNFKRVVPCPAFPSTACLQA